MSIQLNAFSPFLVTNSRVVESRHQKLISAAVVRRLLISRCRHGVRTGAEPHFGGSATNVKSWVNNLAQKPFALKVKRGKHGGGKLHVAVLLA